MLNSRAGMINGNVGSQRLIRGRTVIESDFGREGHALYGPYQPLPAGEYFVQFRISAIDLGDSLDEEIVAAIDVSIDGGRENVAVLEITAGMFRRGLDKFTLDFVLVNKAVVEYRIWVPGKARLEMDAYCPVGRRGMEPEAIQFPKVVNGVPDILRSHEERLRHLYERGFSIAVEGSDVLLAKDGIRFHAREADDLHLIEEIFLEQVYNFESSRPTVVIDIGMNLGLVSMQFARNPIVKKVYSFEPFPSTYGRAQANLLLNPSLATKIVPTNAGVGEIDGPLKIRVQDNGDSGARSTRDTGQGEEIELAMSLAPRVLREVLDANPGCDLVIKIDCEGAEYGIFEKIAQAGLWEQVSAVMVEWHHAIPGKTGADLIEPLKQAGFMVFDRSPHTLVNNYNGFFYAVRQNRAGLA
ncbi:MAG: FkbM family methyltransferase [Novosphingobium sp.]|nr:FkbM family methyltransferase [Novosphingobium sp.]